MHHLVYFADMAFMGLAIIAVYWLAHTNRLPSGLLPGRDLPVWAFCLLLVVSAGFVLVSFKLSCPPDRWDFLHAYYPAGVAALHNDPDGLKNLIGRGTTGFVNIPVVAYLFVPFALMPPEIASGLLTVIGICLLVATWQMLVRLADLKVRERWILAILFLGNGPLIHAVKLGNLSYFILPGLVAGLWCLRSGRSGLAGVLLGVATVIKPPLALFGFFFLFRRDMKGLAGYAAIGMLTICLSLLVYGVATNLYWFDTAIVQYSHKWLAAFNVQSVPAFLLRLDSDAKLSEWFISETPTFTQKLAAQAMTAILLLTTLFACLRGPKNLFRGNPGVASERMTLQYMLVVCLCVVSSPLSWSHYYLWLLMPTAFFLGSNTERLKHSSARTIGWIAAALVTPIIGLPLAIANPFTKAIYQSVLLSHILFGGLVWFFFVAWWLSGTGGMLTNFYSKFDRFSQVKLK